MATVTWLASYPKSGNTWTRALLEGYFGEGAFALEDLGRSIRIGALRSFNTLLGIDPLLLRPAELDGYRPAAARLLARDVADAEGPAVSKIHSANVVAPTGERAFPADAGHAVYVVRNPLDVAASMAPFFNVPVDAAIGWMADDGFVLNDRRGRFAEVLPEPLLSWSGHVASWLDAPGLAVHVVRYEDLQADAAAALAGVVGAMGEAPDPARVAAAVEAARFERLRAAEAAEGFREHPRSASAPFFRRGEAGAWRDELTADQARRVVADHRAAMVRLGYGAAVAEVEAL